MFTNSTQNVNNEGTSFASPIMCYAMTASPSTYPYNEDGSFSTNFPALNGANPIQTEAYNYNRSTINRFRFSFCNMEHLGQLKHKRGSQL